MIRITDISVELCDSKLIDKKFDDKIKKILKLKDVPDYKIIKKSIDSRKKPKLFMIYTVILSLDEKSEEALIKNPSLSRYKIKKYEEKNIENLLISKRVKDNANIAVIGAGPSGLFFAYSMLLRGHCVTVVEQGERIEERKLSVDKFWNEGILNPYSNVQFGEGGAGTFSDGKLNTGANDSYGYQDFVLNTFVKFGADSEILVSSRPHIGTDVLSNVIINMRNYMINNGVKFLYKTKLNDIIIRNNRLYSIVLNNKEFKLDKLVLAIGHSSRDSFKMLYNKGIIMTPKPFAVGIRIQHLQSLIDNYKYGCQKNYLPSADYKLIHHSDKRTTYSFCMCPGGFVVNSSSMCNALTINGMSYNDRGSGIANSAIVTNILPEDYMKDNDPLNGVYYQEELEKKAYKIGNGLIPSEYVSNFIGNKYNNSNNIVPQFKGSYTMVNIRDILDDSIYNEIRDAILAFDKRIKGFADNAICSAIESRTSSPVKIVRDELFDSNIKGIYPIGEGAGYAGGIMSAAIDGLKLSLIFS